jgi:hypothetical protein
MADYRIESRLRSGQYLAALPFRNLQYEMGWNKPYSARFDLPLYHPAVNTSTLLPGLHEIWIWRNGVLIKAGPLWDVTASADDASVNCNMMDIVDYLDTRLVGAQSYTTTDQGSIAWGLINTSQGLTDGALGIVQGTTATAITRSATWKTFDNKYILEAITDMNEMTSGFDFYIDPSTRAFNAIYPRPQRNNNLQLIFPFHIRKYSIQYMGKYLRNSVGVAGTEPAYSTAVDTTSRGTYGLREYADSYRDAATITDLNAYASKLRDIRKDVKAYPTLTLNSDLVDIFDTNVIKYGDLINVQIVDGYVNINTTLRYITAQITVDKQGSESIVLYLQDQRELN